MPWYEKFLLAACDAAFILAVLVGGLALVFLAARFISFAAATPAPSVRFPDLPVVLRCLKLDQRDRELKHEVAHRADGGEWQISCIYSEE